MTYPLPRMFWTLWVGTLINKLGAFVVTFLALYLAARDVPPEQVGFVVSLYGLGGVAAGPVGGILADRIGRKPTLVLSLMGGAALALALGMAESVPVIAALALGYGFLAEMYRPAVSALIADLVPPEGRMRAYGLIYWAVNIGFSVAPVVGGLLSKVSYFALFAADAATTFVYGIIVLVRVREPARVTTRAATYGLGGAMRDPVYVPFVGLTFLIGLVFAQSYVALPMYMGKQGIDAATFGLVIAVNGMLIVALQPKATAWLARLRRSRVLGAGALLAGVGFGLHALVSAPAPHAVAIAVWTIGEILNTPAASSIVADLAPPDQRGRYQGLYSMSWSLAVFLGPMVGSLVAAQLGWSALWGACVGVGVFVAVAHLAIAPARRRRLAEVRLDRTKQAA